ncbi:MAG: DUF1501 domain-containing protein, partial [Verrucomicrobiota bacterium]
MDWVFGDVVGVVICHAIVVAGFHSSTREPRCEAATSGRDHHGRCFTTWLSGGGVKAGYDYGVTDDYAYNITENPVHIRDLNATILHLLGIDHGRFSFKFRG